MTRRAEIAQAAMELAAEGGGHAVTHRRIDRRLGLPEGTTSNYARTRRDLLLLVVERIADLAELRPRSAPPARTAAEAADQLAAAFEAVAARGVDIRARMALTIDSAADLELHELLTTRSPIRAAILAQARQLLTELRVGDVEARARDLVAILNGLFYDRLVGAGLRGTPADARAVLGAWLAGVVG